MINFVCKTYQICFKKYCFKSIFIARVGDFAQIRHLLSDTEIQNRLRDCEDYFDSYPIDAVLYPDDEHQEWKQHQKPPRFAFSHQVHKEIGIFEMLLAVFFRKV